MAKLAAELTDIHVRNLKKPGLYAVGGVPGLYVQVLPSEAKTWVLRASIGGRRRDMGLGGYPEVKLAEAREAAREARKKIREGVDPIEERRQAQLALRRAAALRSARAKATFADATDQFLKVRSDEWRNAKHRQQWRSTLETYAFPRIGKKAVMDITTADVLEVLTPIWREKTETAKRLRGRIEAVLGFAHAEDRKEHEADRAFLFPEHWQNPARWRGLLENHLAKPSKVAKVEHHAALPYRELGDFMARLRGAAGMGARALEFAILTAARSGEARGATWDEVDLEAKVWTIPASRMKAGKEHRVPLSGAAIALLERMRDDPDRLAGSPFVFTAPRGGQLSDMTLSAVLRRMKVDVVPHGFRSTFKDWATEQTSFPGEMAEVALAHAIQNKVEAAYRRGDMVQKRRQLMEAWAKFCATPSAKAGGNVTPIRGAA